MEPETDDESVSEKPGDALLRLKFDGPALTTHEMDVAILCPSLKSLGELIVEANHIINGGAATLRVKLRADIKANCVTLELAIAQQLVTEAKSLLVPENVEMVKGLLEILGLVKDNILAPAATVISSLLGYLLWKKNRAVEEKVNGDKTYNVSIVGDGNNVQIVDGNVVKLAKSPKILDSFKKAVEPVRQPGIDEAEFSYDGDSKVKIDEGMAKALSDINVLPEQPEPQRYTARMVLYTPILNPKVKKWRFHLNGRKEWVDIGSTKIAEEAIERGFHKNDTWTVTIEAKEHRKEDGTYKFSFKALSVLDFQSGLSEHQTQFPPTVDTLLEGEGEDRLPSTQL